MNREHRIEITPAFDRRHPDPSKNYGIHGVEMKFLVIGAEGAIQFVLYTNWMLPHVAAELKRKHSNPFSEPMPADLGYHSRVPMYEDQSQVTQECPYIGGEACYYDGTSLGAEKPWQILIENGGDGLWEFLEGEYARRFLSGGQP